MATIVPAPAGTSNIAANFARVGEQLGQGAASLGSMIRRNREERKRQELLAIQQQEFQRVMQAMNPQQFEQSPPDVGPPAPRVQPSFDGLGNITSPGLQNFLLQKAHARAFPTGKEGFTLGPGQDRFNQSGQRIASVAPTAPTASAQISQAKLDAINKLKAKVKAGEATDGDKKLLNKLLGGGAAVEVNLGRTTGAERTAIAETEASLGALDNLEAIFNDPKTRTGPIVGRVDPIKGLIGKTTEEQEDLMAATSAFKNEVIKAITGAQMSEPEAKRIMKQIPDITDPPTRWKSKMRQTRRNMKQLQEKRADVLTKAGITSPVPDRTGIIPQQNNNPQQPPANNANPADLTRLTDEQLDEMERQLQ